MLATLRPGPLADLARCQGVEAVAFDRHHRFRNVLALAAAVRWLTSVARETGAAVLHSTHTAHLYASPVALFLRLPEVWHMHDTPQPRPDLIERLQRRLPTSHAIFTTRAVAAAHLKLAAGPHSIIAPVCVDPAALAAHPDAPDVLTRLGIPCDGPLLLTIARLQEHKGHADLLAAAVPVLALHANATFVIVGKASGADQTAYLNRLRATADQLGIASQVVFTGFVSDADLAALHRRATALVHPARSEGYGLVLLEAMGSGLPVIAAAAAGPAEVVRDGDNGLLVPVADPPALATAIHRLLTDPALRDRLIAGGLRASVATSASTMTEQTIDVFRRLADCPSPAN